MLSLIVSLVLSGALSNVDLDGQTKPVVENSSQQKFWEGCVSSTYGAYEFSAHGDMNLDDFSKKQCTQIVALITEQKKWDQLTENPERDGCQTALHIAHNGKPKAYLASEMTAYCGKSDI